LRNAIQGRRHHFAGAAPRSPEIHQDRQAAALGVSRERRRIQCDWMSSEQLTFALWALGVLVYPIGRCTDYRVALRAGHQNRIGRSSSGRVHTSSRGQVFRVSSLGLVVRGFNPQSGRLPPDRVLPGRPGAPMSAAQSRPVATHGISRLLQSAGCGPHSNCR
jgi:hypothetical protein